MTTSDAATGSEGVVEGLGNPAADNRKVNCDDEPLALGEDEDGDAEDAVIQVGGAAETSCNPSAEPDAGLSEVPESEGLTGSEDEPPTQAGPMASSATSSIDSVSEFVSSG